jgi:hypothetical protein
VANIGNAIRKNRTVAGSLHAKVGYASLDDGMMQFTASIIGTDGCQSIESAFRMITELAQATVQIVVAACTQEVCGVRSNIARTGAARLARELVDDGGPILPN